MGGQIAGEHCDSQEHNCRKHKRNGIAGRQTEKTAGDHSRRCTRDGNADRGADRASRIDSRRTIQTTERGLLPMPSGSRSHRLDR